VIVAIVCDISYCDLPPMCYTELRQCGAW